MSKEHAYAYEAGYRDGAINYELDHCPACKNIADLQEALDENAKLRRELEQWHKLTEGIELPEYPICTFQPKELERENAELRELLRVAITYCVNGCCGKDDGCPLRLTDYDCQLLTKASELGVEVDG